MKKYIIYLHRNKINNKCYVGQTCQKPEQRWGRNGQNYREQPYFYRAIEKYGWDNFEHIILETDINEDRVDERECFWASYYHALAPEGYTLHVGKYVTKDTSDLLRKTYSEAALERWEDPQYREKIKQGRKKMWQDASDSCKQKMLANLDRTGAGGKARSKQVECIETKMIYASTREAERLTGINHCNISQACNGKRKTAGKFHWRYIE